MKLKNYLISAFTVCAMIVCFASALYAYQIDDRFMSDQSVVMNSYHTQNDFDGNPYKSYGKWGKSRKSHRKPNPSYRTSRYNDKYDNRGNWRGSRIYSQRREYNAQYDSMIYAQKLSNEELVPHGLWPQRDGRSITKCSDPYKRYDKNEVRKLAKDVYGDGEREFPLGLHSWEKHGVCTGWTPKKYFDEIAHYQKMLSTPSIIKDNVGQEVSNSSIKSSYESVANVDLICTTHNSRKGRCPKNRCLSEVRSYWDKDGSQYHGSFAKEHMRCKDGEMYIRRSGE